MTVRSSPALAVAVGAALGALLRWLLSEGLNAFVPSLPPGTLVANLVGGYLIGVAVGFFDRRVDLPPQWRLFAITGFLGGLTTFSTFSAEVVAQLAARHWSPAALEIVVHVVGSVVLTLLGLRTVAWLSGSRVEDGATVERTADDGG